MRKEDIPVIARNALSDLMSESGGILYSSHETLKKGDVYLLGFNPGGSGGPSIEESVEEILSSEINAYLDESWSNGNGSWGAGEATLQRRIVYLLNELGLEPREVCSSNLIFVRSRDEAGVDYSLAKQCWPVHEAIIELVQPKLILAFGNSDKSSYGYLRKLLNGKENSEWSGHGNWDVKGFETELNGRDIYVAGIPHLSRYSPEGKQSVIQWLKSHLNGR